MNRRELQQNLGRITAELLREKGYIAPVDVFLKLGYLAPQDYEAWRRKQVPVLEQVIQVNLSRINFILRTLARQGRAGRLPESWTDYRSWGPGPRVRLRFSKSGEEALERAYATHFLKPPATESAEVAEK